MTDLLQPHASEREAERRAREWLGKLDQQSAVGKRHHIVPRFLLARFASADGKLRVRSRRDGKASTRSISDLAVRDFYTAVTDSSGLDSSLESLLSTVEGGTAEILRQHLDFGAFVKPRAFTLQERATLDAFVAMQAVRGMRIRRSIEVIADYTVKLLNQDKITEEDIRDRDFVPHPNEHLKMFGNLAQRAEETLKGRSTSLIHLDKPLLIIGDEPVLIEAEQHESVNGSKSKPNLTSENFVRLEGGRGFANAEVIMLPVGPAVLLVYGPRGRRNLPAEVHLAGVEAQSFAEELNRLMTSSAIDWVAARPDHPSFESLKVPPPQPLLTVRDYGSSAAARLNSTPARRPIRRLRHEDILEVAESEQT
ncbi:DUF4238 domain-containing protein [Arthrobacter sp. OV608]|uniref:DUF4238 domain-containing protein n=1 Tax=Arthrobacter sp. OV608 TaxID=1882768 RepID=UPI00147C2D92|nr:DUF4238 domain-containing protein [Arthrobacter sp. OV608]